MIAKVKIWISQTHLERSLLTQKAILEASSTTKLTPEVIDPVTSPSNVQFGKEVDLEPGPQPCSKHDGLHIAPLVLGGRAPKDEPSLRDTSGLVIFWGQRFKEWVNLVFLAKRLRSPAKHYPVQYSNTCPLRFKDIGSSEGGAFHYFLNDCLLSFPLITFHWSATY